MDINKAKNYLGIAHKAGYLIIGSDKLNAYKQKLFLVLVDSMAGKSTQKIAESLSQRGVRVEQVDELGKLISIPTCKIVGIKNKSLSENILKNLIEL